MALVALSMGSGAMQPRQAARLVATGAGRCAQSAMRRVERVTTDASPFELRVILLRFDGMAVRTLLFRWPGSRVRCMAGQAGRVGGRERVLCCVVTLLTTNIHTARGTRVRLVTTRTLGMLHARVDLHVAADTGVRRVFCGVHITRMTSLASRRSMTAIDTGRRKLRSVTATAIARCGRVRERVWFVAVRTGGVSRVRPGGPSIDVRLLVAASAGLRARQGTTRVMHAMTAQASAPGLRRMRERDARVAARAGRLAHRSRSVWIVAALAVRMRCAVLLAEHVLLLVAAAARAHFRAFKAVRFVTASAARVSLWRERVRFVVASGAAISCTDGGLVRLVTAHAVARRVSRVLAVVVLTGLVTGQTVRWLDARRAVWLVTGGAVGLCMLCDGR